MLWTDKEGVMQMCFEFADLNSRHRFNKKNTRWKRLGERDLCKRHGLALRAQEQCSMSRITVFHTIQCQIYFFNDLRDKCDEKNIGGI